MRILGIETSCDETGVAIYDEDKGLIANQLYTQIALHADYGGVVPELASRDHIRKTAPLIKAALEEANLTADQIDGTRLYKWPGVSGRIISRRNDRAFTGLCLECARYWRTPYGRSSTCANA